MVYSLLWLVTLAQSTVDHVVTYTYLAVLAYYKANSKKRISTPPFSSMRVWLFWGDYL